MQAVAVDFPSVEAANAFVAYRRQEQVFFPLPGDLTAQLFCRPDRTIEQRDVQYFLQKLYVAVNQHLEVKDIRTTEPDLRIGKNGVDFYAFNPKTEEVHILLSVRKYRNLPLQLTIGEATALAKIKLDASQFQALVDSAHNELKSRERFRL